MDNYAPLLPDVRKFFEYDSLTATHALEAMHEGEAVKILATLNPGLSARIFKNLQVNQDAALLKDVPTDTFKEIVEHIDPQQGASIFMQIPDELRTKLIRHLPDKTRDEIQELLAYPRGSVGSLMTTGYVAFHSEAKTKDVIDNIMLGARMKDPPTSYVYYVVDAENKLVGVLNMRDLISRVIRATLKICQKRGYTQ